MMSYIAASERGRAAALETNTTRRMVKVDRYEWYSSDGSWTIRVVGGCGHGLWNQFTAADGAVPASVGWTYPPGKRKRCPKCPPPVKKPPPPDGERCTYDVSDGRQCATRARWQVWADVWIGEGDGRRLRLQPAVWPLLCEKHRKHLVAEGYLVPSDVGAPGAHAIVPFKGAPNA